jgi:transcriptional regulator with XRE-family HTH domain
MFDVKPGPLNIHTTLVKLESGANNNPTIKTLKKIADALVVTINELVE